MNIPILEPSRRRMSIPARIALILLLVGLVCLPGIIYIFIFVNNVESMSKKLDEELAATKAQLTAIQAEQESWKPTQELDTIGMQAIVTKLRTAFMQIDYGRHADTRDMRGELNYSLWGPSFCDSENGIILAEPSRPSDQSVLQEVAAQANASLDSKAITGDSTLLDELRKGKSIYVFYIAAELQKKLEASDSIRILPKEFLSEKEFHNRFPQGNGAAYKLLQKPNGQYTLTRQCQQAGTDISRAKAMEFVKKHGQPWTFECIKTSDEKTGKKRVSYVVQRYSVDFNAAQVPLVKIIRDKADSVVAITSIKAEGKTEFVTDAKQVKKLVESLLRDEGKYQVDY